MKCFVGFQALESRNESTFRQFWLFLRLHVKKNRWKTTCTAWNLLDIAQIQRIVK